MATLYAEALPDIGAVRLVLNVQDFVDLPVLCQVFRSIVPPDHPDFFDYVQKVRVRPTYEINSDGYQFGAPWEMTAGGVDVWYDTEAPLDTPVWYQIELVEGDVPYVVGTSMVKLVDHGFNTSLDSWVADAGASISHNTATPITGAGSLRITATGGTATIGARSAKATGVVATRRYLAEFVVRAGAAASDVRVAVQWYTAADASITTTIGTLTTLPAGGVVRRWLVLTAPATAAKAELRVRWAGTPPAAAILDVDRARLIELTDGTVDANASPVTLPSQSGGWLSHPLLPAQDVRLSLLPIDQCIDEPALSGVLFVAHDKEARAGSGARFDVVEQAVPSVVSGLRKAPTSTLTLASLTFDDRDRVHDVVADGAVLLFRAPPEFGIEPRFMDVGDVTTSNLSTDLRLPYRVIDLPYATAQPPAGSATAGVLGTRFADLDRFASWTAFDAAGLTSIDLLHGAGSTLGVGA